MNYLSLIVGFSIIILTIVFAIIVVLRAAETTKDLEQRLRDYYVKNHLKKYRRKIFYGK